MPHPKRGRTEAKCTPRTVPVRSRQPSPSEIVLKVTKITAVKGFRDIKASVGARRKKRRATTWGFASTSSTRITVRASKRFTAMIFAQKCVRPKMGAMRDRGRAHRSRPHCVRACTLRLNAESAYPSRACRMRAASSSRSAAAKRYRTVCTSPPSACSTRAKRSSTSAHPCDSSA